jgi:hypothetical protein
LEKKIIGIRILQHMAGVHIPAYTDAEKGIILPDEPWLTWATEKHTRGGKLICELVYEVEKPTDEGGSKDDVKKEDPKSKKDTLDGKK